MEGARKHAASRTGIWGETLSGGVKDRGGWWKGLVERGEDGQGEGTVRLCAHRLPC